MSRNEAQEKAERKKTVPQFANADLQVQNGKLVITVDLTKSQGVSSSGKSQMIASTSGAATISTPGGEIKVNLNVYRPIR
jgi:hypothetical protein